MARSTLTWTRLGAAATLLLAAAAACSKSTGTAVTSPTAVPTGRPLTELDADAVDYRRRLPARRRQRRSVPRHSVRALRRYVEQPAAVAGICGDAAGGLVRAPGRSAGVSVDGSVAVAAMNDGRPLPRCRACSASRRRTSSRPGPVSHELPSEPTAAPSVTPPATAAPTSTPAGRCRRRGCPQRFGLRDEHRRRRAPPAGTPPGCSASAR